MSENIFWSLISRWMRFSRGPQYGVPSKTRNTIFSSQSLRPLVTWQVKCLWCTKTSASHNIACVNTIVNQILPPLWVFKGESWFCLSCCWFLILCFAWLLTCARIQRPSRLSTSFNSLALLLLLFVLHVSSSGVSTPSLLAASSPLRGGL